MPGAWQLFRGLPRTKILASSLLPCQHQSHSGPVPHQAPPRHPSLSWRLRPVSRSYRATPNLHSYTLTPPQVNSILKANEYSFKVCELMLIFNPQNQKPSVFRFKPKGDLVLRCRSLMGRTCRR